MASHIGYIGLYDGIRLFQTCYLDVFSPSPKIIENCKELCRLNLVENTYTISMLNGDLRVAVRNGSYDQQRHHLELMQIARKLNCAWKLHVDKTYSLEY